MSSSYDDQSIATAVLSAQSACPREREILEGEIVAFFQPMSHALAHRYDRRGVDVDDLEQVADLGLLKATRRYDPSAGHLRGYVAATVVGEVKRYFRDHGWTIRPPRPIQDLQPLVMTTVAQMHDDLDGRSPSRRVAESLGLERAVVDEVLMARGGFRCLSLDRAADADGPRLVDQIPEVEDPFADSDRHLFVAAVCASLNDQERVLLHLRFVEELSQSQIAVRLQSSQKQVSRTLERVLSGLRDRALPDAA